MASRYLDLMLACLPALVASAIAPGLLLHFDVTPKLLLLLIGAAGILFTASLTSLSRGFAAARGSRLGRLLLLSFAGMAASLLLSTFFSTHPDLSLSGTNWRRFGLVPQLAVLSVAAIAAARGAVEPRLVNCTLRAIAAAGVPVSLYGMLQYFHRDPFLDAHTVYVIFVRGAARPHGTLGHAAYFATFLGHVFFAGWALLRAESSRRWRWLGIAAMSLAVPALILSGSRAGALGILAAGLTLALWQRKQIRWAGLGAAAAVSLVVMAAFYVSPAGGSLRIRAGQWAQDRVGGTRLPLWRDTLSMAGQRVLLGFGPESFSPDFPRFESAGLARAFPDSYHESPHNILLDALVSQGWPGLLFLLGILGAGLTAAPRAVRKAPATAVPLAATLVAATVSQQFIHFILPTQLLLYWTAASLVALAAEPRPAIAPSPRRKFVITRLMEAGALALAAFAVCFAAGDWELASARQFLDEGDLLAAQEEYRGSNKWLPPGAGADLWFSRALAEAAQRVHNRDTAALAWQGAVDAAVQAAGRSEVRHNAFYHLATLYAMENDVERTEQALRAAIAWSPNWFKPHWMLARLLHASGRREEAKIESQKAVSLNPTSREVAELE